VIDRAYDGTVLPLSIGLFISGVLALLAVRWAGSHAETQI
jgi:hypothetical protein